MRIYYSMLIGMLVFNLAFSQEKEEVAQDTSAQKTVVLDEVLIKGNVKSDPVFIQVSNDYQKNINQIINVLGIERIEGEKVSEYNEDLIKKFIGIFNLHDEDEKK